MTLDPSVLAASITTIGVITVAGFGYITARFNKADYERKEAAHSADLQLKEIHTLTNDNLSKMTKKLDESTAEVVSLKALMAEMRNPTVTPVPAVSVAKGKTS